MDVKGQARGGLPFSEARAWVPKRQRFWRAQFASRPMSPPRKPKASAKSAADRKDILYGRHAVEAALRNPDRRIERLALTENAAKILIDLGAPRPKDTQIYAPKDLQALAPPGAVHQGFVAVADPPPALDLADLLAGLGSTGRLVVLDQVTDPQNIGAVLRSAAGFGVAGVICQDRKTPALSGALEKAAAGAVERVPVARVVNIARALDALGDHGVLRVGLAGEGAAPIGDAVAMTSGPLALVLGAEGAGLRRLVRETCDVLAHIPISKNVESLNVSNAAAVALYAAAMARSGAA